MTPDDEQPSAGEPHPLDVHLARMQAAQQGHRRSLWTSLRRARRGEVDGDDAGEAAFFALTVVMIAVVVIVLAVVGGLIWWLLS
jgi:hypothetical protein